MSVRNPKGLFVLMLSGLRQGTEQTSRVFQELGQAVQDPNIRELREAQRLVSHKIIGTLDQCFKAIGEKPVKTGEHLYEVFVQDLRKKLAEIDNSMVRKLFVLAQASRLIHLRIAEYQALIAAADTSGHYGMVVLLETCIAEKLILLERVRRLMRHFIEVKMVERIAAESAA